MLTWDFIDVLIALEKGQQSANFTKPEIIEMIILVEFFLIC